VTIKVQRDAFRRALRSAREDRGLSQRAVARAVGRTPGAVWQWEQGKGAPNLETVTKLEALLRLEADELARLLGYVPPSPSVDRRTGVVDAVNADPRLGDSERELLRAVYRWLVRHRDATGHGS
jgi:transcriptional regulator with XRE-family HTH domain